ncbi:YxlC family protein [Paenibacillus sp. FSL K6-3182]|uniref:YxlC family protein n=1 Tax=unclassified Paenibacillus TaxID=185978 RepID=UPI0030CE0590
MKKLKEETEDQKWFDDQLQETLNRFDAIHAPHVPELQRFEDMVDAHKQQMKRKLWKDLLIFWLLACLIFGMMMWMLDRNLVWFAVLQVVIAVGSIGFVGITFGRRKVRTWKS